MSNPEISVAMATYNGGAFIDVQLDSLANQTRPPAELIVVDDGSADDTLARVEAFARGSPFPVNIIRNETRLGWRGNFIKAAGLCRHDLIAFSDQDDVWYPPKLETMGTLFRDPRVLLGYHDADILNQAGAVIGTLRKHESDRSLLPPRARPTTWSHPAGLTLMFRRILLRFQSYWHLSIDPRESRFPAAHDQWFYCLATNLGFVASTPERLVGYRQHGGNAVGFKPARGGRRSVLLGPKQAPSSDHLLALATFCRVLRRAAEDPTIAAALPELPAAIDANERLHDRMHRDHLAHHDRGLLRRTRHLAALLRTAAYSRKTEWNLGYRALLGTALIGVPFGR